MNFNDDKNDNRLKGSWIGHQLYTSYISKKKKNIAFESTVMRENGVSMFRESPNSSSVYLFFMLCPLLMQHLIKQAWLGALEQFQSIGLEGSGCPITEASLSKHIVCDDGR